MEPTLPVSYRGGVQSPSVSGLQGEMDYHEVSRRVTYNVQRYAAEYSVGKCADATLFRLPIPRNETNETLEQSLLMTGDIFATGWEAGTWSGYQPGDSMVVFGAGPVGLVAALRGASHVYTVDHVQERLDIAKAIGATLISFVESDPALQTRELEPTGAQRAVDCVGLEALNDKLAFDPSIIVRQMVNVTGFEGGLGQVGVHTYTPGTYAAQEHPPLSADINFPAISFWTKSLHMQAGIVQPYRITPQPINVVASGNANTSFIITAIINIDDSPTYYEKFNRTEEVKVLISFNS